MRSIFGHAKPDGPPPSFPLAFLGRPSMEAFFGHPREPLSGY